jgi:hypothetical protein
MNALLISWSEIADIRFGQLSCEQQRRSFVVFYAFRLRRQETLAHHHAKE